jgi:hypothetical protein
MRDRGGNRTDDGRRGDGEDKARPAEKVQVREQSLALDLAPQESTIDLAVCVKLLNVHDV